MLTNLFSRLLWTTGGANRKTSITANLYLTLNKGINLRKYSLPILKTNSYIKNHKIACR